MKTHNWNIRKATIDDAEGLRNCMFMAYSEYQDRFKGLQLPPMEVDYEEEIKSYPVWIAESGKEIVGGLVLVFEQSSATIANVAVRPDFQGHGLGRGLMTFAESVAREKGYQKMGLATHVLFSKNVSVYSRMGWTEVGRDDTRVYMEKQVSK